MLKPFSGGTFGMLGHLRVRHSTEAKAFMGEAHETSSIAGDPDMETEVVVALEDEDCGTLVTKDDNEHNEVSNRPVRRLRSLIWRHFDDLVSLDAARCRICKQKLQCCEGKSTSNLNRHLSAKHPEVFSQLVADRQNRRSTSNIRQHMSTKQPEVFFVQLAKRENPQPSCSSEVSVDMALGDEEGNGTEFSSALDSLLAAEQGDPANPLTNEEAIDEQPPRRQLSLIWRHFKRLKGLTAVRCHICMKKLQYTDGSTGNMRRHMSSKHPDVFSQQLAKRPARQQPLSAEVSEVAPDDDDSPAAGNDTDFSPAADIVQDATVKQTKRRKACDGRPATRQQRLIWKHFELLHSLGAARCLVCMKKMRYVEGGSISSLRQHMAKRHPELLAQLVANGQNLPPPQSPPSSDVNGHSSTPSEADGRADDRLSPGERRLFRTEQKLIESLRRAQREEAQALQHQRELLEKLRAVNAREAAAERQQIETLRKVQLEEAKDLSRQKEELQKEKAELRKERDELQQEREELRMIAKPLDSTR